MINKKETKMRLITYRPILRPTTIFNNLDRLFNNSESVVPGLWKPSFEVINIDKSYRLRAEIPGMTKKDIIIEIKDDVLTISGERKFGNNSVDDNHYSEFSYGKFSRSFNLPEDVLKDNIKASMKDGILALEIPRAKQVKPEIKKIAIR
jgi:HSP20 family protein